MTTEPVSSTPSSIDATQRRLIIGIATATLLLLIIVLVDLDTGGRPDPPHLRAAATVLDGSWRFHVGDDLRWANADTDDSDWETIDMTALPGSHDGDVGLPDYVEGWAAHGHHGYHGYAWYRRAVTVPAGYASWVILGPTLVEDGYELYWNGAMLGGAGGAGREPALGGGLGGDGPGGGRALVDGEDWGLHGGRLERPSRDSTDLRGEAADRLSAPRSEGSSQRTQRVTTDTTGGESGAHPVVPAVNSLCSF